MAPFNLPYTIIVGVAASLCGVIRMLKTPQLNKVYFQKVLMNNHGQNVLYLGMGSFGVSNLLFYSPIMLYFFYGLAEFYNLKFPVGSGNPKIRSFIDQIRTHRWFFM
jgi:H+/Cl- antiporter ClcA